MASFTLRKQDKLKSRKLIEKLFDSGDSSFVYPIKLMYLDLPVLDSKLKMAVTVPKRQFKRAVDRNKLKRKIREAYRQHKPTLEHQLSNHPNHHHLILMFIYVGKGIEEYSVIEKAVKKLLSKALRLNRET